LLLLFARFLSFIALQKVEILNNIFINYSIKDKIKIDRKYYKMALLFDFSVNI
jgi:hypothetical protein